jgi:uncharacterized membrane protein YidH (DUF202 family)
LRKLKNIGTAIAILAMAIAVIDLLNVGAFVFSEYTGIPLEAVPKEAPNWVRCTCLAFIVAGFTIRYMAKAITTLTQH